MKSRSSFTLQDDFLIRQFYQGLATVINNNAHVRNTCITLNNEATSYEKFSRDIRIIAKILHENTRENEPVYVILPRGIEICVFYLAALFSNRLICPIESECTDYEIGLYCKTVRPRHVIVNEERADANLTALLKDKGAQSIIPINLNKLHNSQNQINDKITPQIKSITDNAIIFFSSGTTGRPKGIPHTYKSIYYATQQVNHVFQLNKESRLFITKSHFSPAFLRNFLNAIVNISTIHLLRKSEIKTLLLILEKKSPTHIRFGIDIIKALAKLPNECFSREMFNKLQACDCSGDVLSAHIQKKLTTLIGKTIIPSYGMTETNTISYNDSTDANKLGSVGIPCPEVEIKIIDQEGNELPPNVPGQLIVKSPAAITKYWDNIKGETSVFKDGWLHTGDCFKKDEDGFLWYQARIKNLITRGGTTVSLCMIRNVLLSHESIYDAIAIGEAHKIYGEIPIVFCTETQNQALDKLNLVEHIKNNISKTARPTHLYFLDSLPATQFGKVDQSVLKQKTNYWKQCAIKTLVIS